MLRIKLTMFRAFVSLGLEDKTVARPVAAYQTLASALRSILECDFRKHSVREITKFKSQSFHYA